MSWPLLLATALFLELAIISWWPKILVVLELAVVAIASCLDLLPGVYYYWTYCWDNRYWCILFKLDIVAVASYFYNKPIW